MKYGEQKRRRERRSHLSSNVKSTLSDTHSSVLDRKLPGCSTTRLRSCCRRAQWPTSDSSASKVELIKYQLRFKPRRYRLLYVDRVPTPEATHQKMVDIAYFEIHLLPSPVGIVSSQFTPTITIFVSWFGHGVSQQYHNVATESRCVHPLNSSELPFRTLIA